MFLYTLHKAGNGKIEAIIYFFNAAQIAQVVQTNLKALAGHLVNL